MEPGFLRANTGRTAIQDIGGKAGPSENSTNFEAKRHSQWYSGCEEYNTQLGWWTWFRVAVGETGDSETALPGPPAL